MRSLYKQCLVPSSHTSASGSVRLKMGGKVLGQILRHGMGHVYHTSSCTHVIISLAMVGIPNTHLIHKGEKPYLAKKIKSPGHISSCGCARLKYQKKEKEKKGTYDRLGPIDLKHSMHIHHV